MKGKLWELGPFALAILVGLYFAAARLLHGPPPPSLAETPPVEAPRSGTTPRLSSGPQDPTKPEDFLPDAHSEPDPNSRPDPALSTVTRPSPSAKR